jgi:hypothetical protein
MRNFEEDKKGNWESPVLSPSAPRLLTNDTFPGERGLHSGVVTK